MQVWETEEEIEAREQKLREQKDAVAAPDAEHAEQEEVDLGPRADYLKGEYKMHDGV